MRALLLAALLFLLSAGVAAADVTPEMIIMKYGKPDVVTSSEYEKPRPPIVMKFLDYKRQRVRFLFVADAPVGSPPPYASWKLVGLTDPTTNTVMKGDEVQRRMGK